mmetsp:Transcript_21725/g.43957  ORF Transcript_21725/g.43957 Transcript_21725/m.43957 type:complete len:122 (-) Transcript_21725:900-1265(-)
MEKFSISIYLSITSYKAHQLRYLKYHQLCVYFLFHVFSQINNINDCFPGSVTLPLLAISVAERQCGEGGLPPPHEQPRGGSSLVQESICPVGRVAAWIASNFQHLLSDKYPSFAVALPSYQ